MFAWLKWIVKEHKAIASFVVFILGIAGVSIYGNVKEINPWKVVEEAVVEEIESLAPIPVAPSPQVKIIERTIETRVETGITKLQVDAAIEAFMESHIREYH